MEKLVLIDGHSILNRAFYGVPDLTNSEGLHTNAVYGFLNIMFKILEEEKADHLAVAFDLKEPTFRHKMYEEYKGTRKPMPQELHEQVPLMKEVLAAMGIPILTKAGFEADDILGTVAKHQAGDKVEVSIVSGDRDLLQLADEHIKIRIPKTLRGGTEVKDYYPEDVKREYGVTPKEFIDVKALMGDASDNIPGVPSIGEKTATAIISAYGSIENAYAHLEEIKPPRARKALEEHYDMAQMSKKLAEICTDCGIDFSYDDAKIDGLYTEEAYQYMKRLEFKSILPRFAGAAQESGAESLREHFAVISDLGEVESVLKKAEKAERIGAQLIMKTGKEAGSQQAVGLALCFGDEECVLLEAAGFVTGEYLAGKMEELCKKPGLQLWTIDLKSQLSLLNIDWNSGARDGMVAAYLLNPLKDSYDYDDLARDYLKLTLPSKVDLLGKADLGSSLEQGEEKALTCVCYMAYTAYASGPRLLDELKNTGMEKLFLEEEMPLMA